jgi:hypothetical protein
MRVHGGPTRRALPPCERVGREPQLACQLFPADPVRQEV